jgi:N-acetyl-gamma-glutamyl-phosphate reductase
MNVAIIGATGYTGLELVKILLNHPKFNLTYIANSEGDIKLSDLHPSLKGVCEFDVVKADAKEVAKSCELAFLALPHKTAMLFAKELLSLGVKVVDLSADYRLSLENYEKVYCPHLDKENLKSAVYGLPEYFLEQIKGAKLIANPGCYPTATLLGLLPFVDYIDESSLIFVDAKSGVSGAGKKLSENAHFPNLNENLFAYSPLAHRHSPEIGEKITVLKKKSFQINFVPQLLPLTRGMLINTYVTLKDSIEPMDILKKAYGSSKFIRLRDKPVDIKSVAGTNFCDIYVKSDGKALLINSSIDNLLRGASSQAVVNANLMSGFDEDLGIPKIAYIP